MAICLRCGTTHRHHVIIATEEVPGGYLEDTVQCCTCGRRRSGLNRRVSPGYLMTHQGPRKQLTLWS